MMIFSPLNSMHHVRPFAPKSLFVTIGTFLLG